MSFDWNMGSFTAVDSDFCTLPAGEYACEITGFEQTTAQSDGCPMAKFKVRVDGGEAGRTTVTEYIKLHENCLWKMTQFFKALGMFNKQTNQITPDWREAALVGQQARVKLLVEDFEKNDGTVQKNNKIDAWLPPAIDFAFGANSPQMAQGQL